MKILLSILLVLSTYVLAKKDPSHGHSAIKTNDSKQVQLLDESYFNSKKIVVIFEDNDIVIQSTLELFKKDFYISREKQFIKRITEEVKKNKVNYVKKLFENNIESNIYFYSDLLKSGKIAAFNKSDNSYFKYLTIEESGVDCGYKCGEGEGRYKIGDKVLVKYTWVE